MTVKIDFKCLHLYKGMSLYLLYIFSLRFMRPNLIMKTAVSYEMLLSKSEVVMLFGIYLISDNYCFFLGPAEVTWKFVGSLPRPCQGSQQGVYNMETSEPRPGEKASEAKAVHTRLGSPFQRTSGSQPFSSSPSTTRKQIVNQDPG